MTRGGSRFFREFGSPDAAVLALKCMVDGLPSYAAAVDPGWACGDGQLTIKALRDEAVRIGIGKVVLAVCEIADQVKVQAAARSPVG